MKVLHKKQESHFDANMFKSKFANLDRIASRIEALKTATADLLRGVDQLRMTKPVGYSINTINHGDTYELTASIPIDPSEMSRIDFDSFIKGFNRPGRGGLKATYEIGPNNDHRVTFEI